MKQLSAAQRMQVSCLQLNLSSCLLLFLQLQHGAIAYHEIQLLSHTPIITLFSSILLHQRRAEKGDRKLAKSRKTDQPKQYFIQQNTEYNSNQHIIKTMQRPYNIQQHLLDYSTDSEVPYIPVFVQGRFYKRISREQIKGWSEAHPFQLFHKEKSSKKIKENVKLTTIDFSGRKKNIAKSMGNVDTLRQFHSARELPNNSHSQTGSLFKTFQEMPALNPQTLQKTQLHQQEQKLDFIKGRKMTCPKVRNTLIVKPLFTTFSIRNDSSKTKKSYTLPEKQSSRKTSIRSLSRQKAGVSMISYPIDNTILQERDYESKQSRIASFMRKLKR